MQNASQIGKCLSIMNSKHLLKIYNNDLRNDALNQRVWDEGSANQERVAFCHLVVELEAVFHIFVECLERETTCQISIHFGDLFNHHPYQSLSQLMDEEWILFQDQYLKKLVSRERQILVCTLGTLY